VGLCIVLVSGWWLYWSVQVINDTTYLFWFLAKICRLSKKGLSG
jgi:hypothetical protein